jgi:hypothetical protein
MNGIDTAVASLLASRVDSLLSIGARADAAASQTGASALSVDTPVARGGALPDTSSTPPASAQTALSAVALTLDAIARSGGDATPAVVGQTPVWPAAPALDVALAEPLPLFDTLATDASATATAGATPQAGAAPSAAAGAAAGAAATSVVASPLPVAALAAALRQTVAESGLFYESHLAQWLSGQRTPASLAGEPQNRLVDAAAQLPLDWSADADASAQPWSTGAGLEARAAAGLNRNPAAAGTANTRAAPDGPQAQAARFATADSQGNTAFSGSSSSRSQMHGAAGDPLGLDTHDAPPQQSAAPAIHPATVPLVRQQLDLLATGEFRWTGEAWPGARLDWTIQQEGDEWHRGGKGVETDDSYPWRTRLTLSLPSLGTVDAELTLTGTQLVARVQANPGGAARLAEQGETFRQRLAAAGIELSGLSIREIGGGAPAVGTSAAAAAAQATTAYARSAAAGDEATAASAARRRGAGTRGATDYDWDLS